jgi:hypothetical protein
MSLYVAAATHDAPLCSRIHAMENLLKVFSGHIDPSQVRLNIEIFLFHFKAADFSPKALHEEGKTA